MCPQECGYCRAEASAAAQDRRQPVRCWRHDRKQSACICRYVALKVFKAIYTDGHAAANRRTIWGHRGTPRRAVGLNTAACWPVGGVSSTARERRHCSLQNSLPAPPRSRTTLQPFAFLLQRPPPLARRPAITLVCKRWRRLFHAEPSLWRDYRLMPSLGASTTSLPWLPCKLALLRRVARHVQKLCVCGAFGAKRLAY